MIVCSLIILHLTDINYPLCFLLIGLVSSLGYDTIDDIIEQMKHNRVFSQKEYYSRIKSKYRKMSKMRIEREDTINEINEKVKEVVLVQKSM